MTGKNESVAAAKADAPLAWRLADSTVALVGQDRQAFQRLESNLLVAMVLARAELADSARHVLSRSRGDAQVDPTRDVLQFAAFVDVLLGDKPGAIDDLTTYFAASKGRRESFASNSGWWYDPLKELPAYKSLVGAPAGQ